MRTINDGPVGQLGGKPPSGDYSVCWSRSLFTIENTNNGETYVNDGPLEYTYSTTYYRMNIDRSVSPTEYCQVAMVTGPENATFGDTYVVPLVSGRVPSVPALHWWALWMLVGITGVVGARRLRKVS